MNDALWPSLAPSTPASGSTWSPCAGAMCVVWGLPVVSVPLAFLTTMPSLTMAVTDPDRAASIVAS